MDLRLIGRIHLQQVLDLRLLGLSRRIPLRLMVQHLLPWAIFGLIVGSYLNVVVYRLPLGLSTVYPRSRCPGSSMRRW